MATGGIGGWEEGQGQCEKGLEGYDKRYGFSFLGSHFYIKGEQGRGGWT